jgi:hypothetical protein
MDVLKDINDDASNDCDVDYDDATAVRIEDQMKGGIQFMVTTLL